MLSRYAFLNRKLMLEVEVVGCWLLLLSVGAVSCYDSDWPKGLQQDDSPFGIRSLHQRTF